MRGEPVGIDDPILWRFRARFPSLCGLVNGHGVRYLARPRAVATWQNRRTPQPSSALFHFDPRCGTRIRTGSWGTGSAAQAGTGNDLDFQKRRVEQLGLIARAVVAQDRHDGVAGPQLAGQADGPGDVDAGRAADAQAFLAEQLEDDAHGFLVGDQVGRSMAAPSRFLVMRPWPMPSVMEEPSAFSTPVV